MLGYEERIELKQAVSAAKKARLRRRMPDLEDVKISCSTCGMPVNEFDPGCKTCRIRAYGRVRRGRFPGGYAAYRIIVELNVIEASRKGWATKKSC